MCFSNIRRFPGYLIRSECCTQPTHFHRSTQDIILLMDETMEKVYFTYYDWTFNLQMSHTRISSGYYASGAQTVFTRPGDHTVMALGEKVTTQGTGDYLRLYPSGNGACKRLKCEGFWKKINSKIGSRTLFLLSMHIMLLSMIPLTSHPIFMSWWQRQPRRSVDIYLGTAPD
ncbi:hypothetical protein CHS0354_025302 [Potamilus streckersoni]|uniref:Uncharacterized protein n=1 Tax=Potamilus streckersoni TaxID=2493646 RepID=A0AAE0RUP1_9BIVA|nr:hypothetical protein CHS0354_025302 [Potamilus streckersoni]